MTSQAMTIHNPSFRKYLDHGFVGLVDSMGSDESIEAAARLSYGRGTRSKNDTRNLIRYLVRHRHTSPLEMGELIFHIKLPIFVMRQLVRHRTASLNEYSGRYSEMVDDFYVPPEARIQSQSSSNKQGSGDALSVDLQCQIQDRIRVHNENSYQIYEQSLDDGLSRELARITLPVSNYTEVYWKCDLNNFFKMLQLRMDPHAQQEIVELANLMYLLAKEKFPICFEAFDDYVLDGCHFSRMEMKLLRSMLREESTEQMSGIEAGLSAREVDEFKAKLKRR